MIAFVVVAFVACADPSADPSDVPPLVGDAPPAVVNVPAVRPVVVVVELTPLGVDEATARRATTLVVERLGAVVATHAVRPSKALDAAARSAAAACESAACFVDVAAAANARGVTVDVIVHGTVQKLGAGHLVTLDAGPLHAVASSADPGQLDTVVDAACDSLAQQIARSPAAVATPKTTANPTTPPPTTAPPTTTPPSTTNPNATTKPPTPTTPPPAVAGAPHDDFLLLAIDYAMLLLPIPGSGFLLPLAQGAVHGFGGKQIVNNEYPNWWVGTLAGYGVYIVGGFLTVGLYATGLTIGTGGNEGLGVILILGAVGTLGITVLTEPLAVWLGARTGAIGLDEDSGGGTLLKGSPLAGVPIGAVPDDVAAAHFPSR